jgi:uncharacterized protein (UPF0332 family)
MSKDDLRDHPARYWMEKADEALASAQSEQEARRYTFAVNRAYYACFYAASSVLFKRGVKFKKHSGVRAAVHREFVRTGAVSTEMGKFYDYAFDSRQRGDYQEMVDFPPDQVEDIIENAKEFHPPYAAGVAVQEKSP